MVHLRALRPDYFAVGANIINQPLSSWLHLGPGRCTAILAGNRGVLPQR